MGRFDSHLTPVYLFIFAFAVRLASTPLSISRVNPYSQGDAVGFTRAAATIAERFGNSGVPWDLAGYSTAYEIWGTILSPFWLLPGPSQIYALLFVCGLGAFSVYNVACLAQWFHSSRAALFAGLPLAVYPSIVMTQSTLLREAAIVCGITTAARYLIAPPPRLGREIGYIIAGSTLLFVSILRPENVPIYLTGLGVALVVRLAVNRPKLLGISTIVAPPLGLFVVLPYISERLGRLLDIREYRGIGRTAYLTDLTFQSIYDLIVFSWIGAAYFMYAPFPWMIGVPADAVIALEALISIGFTIAAVASLPVLRARSQIGTIALVVAFLAGLVIYGIGSVNVGTATRHRPMFLWVIFLFGGIGLASRTILK